MVEQIAALVLSAAAGEELAGIYSSQVILAPGKAHKVTGKATIDTNGMLAIAPGATLEFEPGADGSPAVLTVMGRLLAQGKKKEPIILKGQGVLCVGKELTIRESMKIKKMSPVCMLANVALDGVRLVSVVGEAQVQDCAFGGAGIVAQGGKLVLRQCTIRRAPNAGLDIERYDTYPAVQVVASTFERCDVGMRISAKTLRPERSYIGVSSCNFSGNDSASIIYDDSADLAVGRIYFDGELEAGRGRFVVQQRASAPISLARAPDEIVALLSEE